MSYTGYRARHNPMRRQDRLSFFYNTLIQLFLWLYYTYPQGGLTRKLCRHALYEASPIWIYIAVVVLNWFLVQPVTEVIYVLLVDLPHGDASKTNPKAASSDEKIDFERAPTTPRPTEKLSRYIVASPTVDEKAHGGEEHTNLATKKKPPKSWAATIRDRLSYTWAVARGYWSPFKSEAHRAEDSFCCALFYVDLTATIADFGLHVPGLRSEVCAESCDSLPGWWAPGGPWVTIYVLAAMSGLHLMWLGLTSKWYIDKSRRWRRKNKLTASALSSSALVMELPGTRIRPPQHPVGDSWNLTMEYYE